MEIKTVRDLMVALRQGSYSSVGGYPLFFVTYTGETLLPATVRSDVWSAARAVRDHDFDRIVALAVNWEDPDLYDRHTGERIPSAYAEEEEEP